MRKILYGVDWVLFLSALLIVFLGLVTMKSFPSATSDPSYAGSDYSFNRQLIWLGVALAVFFTSAYIDWNFLKANSIFLLIIYGAALSLLLILAFSSNAVRGSSSWLRIFSLTIEPVELMKPVLVLILAKYFSKRHVEIARFFHLFISSMYVGIPIILIMLQPDLGSAIVLGALWLGIAIVSGIKFRHLAMLFFSGIFLVLISWNFVLYPYQKERVVSFLNPYLDPAGAGYQATQSMIALGSGKLFGKGVGLGTQSRLEFLPEHTTDFIFAAFAEEWGFLGVLIFFLFLSILIWRILRSGIYGESNFEKLYAAGLAILIFFQSAVHIGMNAGVLPITGLGMPFLSYGGSSLVSLFLALGVLESLSIYKKGIFIGHEERYKEGVLT